MRQPLSTLPTYYLAAVVPDDLRNKLCGLCRTPVDDGYRFCYRCHHAPAIARPDLTGFTTYAIARQQSGTDMHRYKGRPTSAQALNAVQLLLAHGLEHTKCASRSVGFDVDALAVMPSRSHSAPGVRSPLQQLCARLRPHYLPLVDLQPAPGATSDRRVHADAFNVSDCQGLSHVLLVDDTWVSGATVMSATTAMRLNGAEHISILVLARWLDQRYPLTKRLLDEADRGAGWISPQQACPFTLDGSCPA